MDSQSLSISLQSTQSTRKRKVSSRCWKTFEKLPARPDGTTYAKCTKCGRELITSASTGTKNLLRHHDGCKALGISPRSATRSSTFQYDRFCELVIEAVIKHNLPFNFVEYEGIRAIFYYVSPELCLPSRNTVKNHVMKVYEIEKLKVQQLLYKANGRICLTSDLWSSITTEGYLALTAHFIDGEWNLQSKVLNVCHMPPPHTGDALVEKINSLICDWGVDRNLFSITLDNASANDSFVQKLKTQLDNRGLLLENGRFFHIRCCAHILNLIVQDGLKMIDDSVIKVRDSVRYIRGSMTRKHRFYVCSEQVGLGNRRSLRSDCPTRWNSTYLMLESALYFSQALGQFALVDSEFKTCPTTEEWGRIKVICKFLREFNEVTTLFSGTKYVTSNLFFPKIFMIQHLIHQAKSDKNLFMRQMGDIMGLKFQKYWSDYSVTLGIAVVMDPRYKLEFVTWAYSMLYGEDTTELTKFRDTLYALYEAYMRKWSTESTSVDQTMTSCSSSQDADALFERFDSSYSVGTSFSVKNELTCYLEDRRLERKSELNVLNWWNNEKHRYPILSRLASDMLMIPVSTVASESVFSIGGKVLDQYRSLLLPETVQALLCTRDWLYDRKFEDLGDADLYNEDALELNFDQIN